MRKKGEFVGVVAMALAALAVITGLATFVVFWAPEVNPLMIYGAAAVIYAVTATYLARRRVKALDRTRPTPPEPTITFID